MSGDGGRDLVTQHILLASKIAKAVHQRARVAALDDVDDLLDRSSASAR